MAGMTDDLLDTHRKRAEENAARTFRWWFSAPTRSDAETLKLAAEQVRAGSPAPLTLAEKHQKRARDGRRRDRKLGYGFFFITVVTMGIAAAAVLSAWGERQALGL